MSFWSDWAPRKTAAQRRADSARQIRDAARRGKPMSPVVLAGRKIAQTFWGQAWCDNLERYQDFAYRLDRGRSYLRSGSVIDLRIEPGKILASVSGSSLYEVAIAIDGIKPDAWRALQRECAGGIGSRLDLLAGRLSDPVMARLCADRTGMFPAPSSIRFTCSCPDHAIMCKHVAAAMYGVAARLDHAPELLFTLRRVSLDELLASALSDLPAQPSPNRVLATGGLAALFGLELADPTPAPPRAPPRPPQPAPSTGAAKSAATRSAAVAKSAAARSAAARSAAARSAAVAKSAAARPAAAKSAAAKSKAAKPAVAKSAAAKSKATKTAVAKSAAAKSTAARPTAVKSTAAKVAAVSKSAAVARSAAAAKSTAPRSAARPTIAKSAAAKSSPPPPRPPR